MNFAAQVGQSSDPAQNTASGYARRCAQAARLLADVLDRAAIEADRVEQRERDAYDRIENVHRLFWLLAAARAGHKVVDELELLPDAVTGGWSSSSNAIVEQLAAALGIDDYALADVQIELAKRGWA